MLVCNVSLRAPRGVIAVGLIEPAAAADDVSLLGAAFAALVDDPASANESVDGYVGSIMLEAAAASDTVDVIFAYTVDVVEAATAADTLDAVATGAVTARQAMTTMAFVNSSGTPRQANANGVMVNL